MSNAATNLRSQVSPDAARARTVDARRRLAGRLPAAAVLTLAFVIALQHQPKHAGRVARAVDQGSTRPAASSRPWTEPFAATLAPRSRSAGWLRSTSSPTARAAEHEALHPLQVRGSAASQDDKSSHTPEALASGPEVTTIAPAREFSPSAPSDPPVVEPPPSAPLEISDVVIRAWDTAAAISWRTSFPAASQGAYGTKMPLLTWTERMDGLDLAHETIFPDLAPSTAYRLMLQAVDKWGRATTVEADIVTAPPLEDPGVPPAATTDGDTILVSGHPFFPRALLEECSNLVPKRREEGINLFIGDGCDGDRPGGSKHPVSGALDGGAYAVTDARLGRETGPNIIGWYYIDELDARLPVPVTADALDASKITAPSGLLRFLTLTNHFYTGANPLQQGRDFYPALISLADVVGFDLYPLQNWCQPEKMFAVFDAQRELDLLAKHKPTFQWIEVRAMDCEGAELDPSATTVRAETWLAIAGGADGIGYFPHEWRPSVGEQIQQLNEEIAELAPALLSTEVAGESNPGVIRIGAWSLNGATYVAAVNPTTVPLDASIHVAGLGGGVASVLDESRTVTTTDDTLSDHFGPLAVHLYIVAPPGWAPVRTPVANAVPSQGSVFAF